MSDTTKPDFAAAGRWATELTTDPMWDPSRATANLARAYLASRAELATVQAERDAARADVRRLIEQNDETTREWGEDVTRLRAELATLRDTLVGEVEARLHEKRMSFEMSGPHGDVDYRATFSFDEGGSWVRWPEIAAILNAIKGTP